MSSSIDDIKSSAFSGLESLTTINCNALVPPTLGEDVFYYLDKSTIELNVPVGASNLYGSTDIWKEFIIYPPVGVSEIVTTSINIYPNPSSDILNITGTDVEKVQILDLSGKIILTSRNSKLDLSELNNGIYLIKVLSAKGDIINSKVIKK